MAAQLYRLFWIGVFVAIAVLALPKFGKPESALALKDLGPDGSVNSVLEQTLNQSDAAQRIQDWAKALPEGQPILVVAPPNNMPAALTADMVSYLAWPRPVVISTETDKTKRLLANARRDYCAVGLCYMEPPPGAPISGSFGPALNFIRTR